jgi:CheY-like chemotaxis protein
VRGTETILLVEDDKSVRNLAARVLREKGYVVLEAQDADEALRLASHQPGKIDLALSDVVMPGASGHELARLLHAQHPGLRLILMSGYNKALGKGLPDIDADVRLLSKPFTPNGLLTAVRAALDGVVEPLRT